MAAPPELQQTHADTDDFPAEFAPLARRMRRELRQARKLDPHDRLGSATRAGRRAARYRARAVYLATRAYDVAVDAGVSEQDVRQRLALYRDGK